MSRCDIQIELRTPEYANLSIYHPVHGANTLLLCAPQVWEVGLQWRLARRE